MIARGKSVFQSEKDIRIKIINERINSVEKHMSEMCSAFAAFNRKLGRYRDKHDELAKIIKTYSEEEISNNSLKHGLDSFSKAITLLSDYLDLEVQRIDLQIVNELKQYESICRNARENLKVTSSVRDKELLRQKQLIDLKTKYTANTPAANSELLKMKIEMNKTNMEIDTIVENFEKQKLKDIKHLLLNFTYIQLKQNTKSIEVLSALCQDILNIDEKRDFQAFKKSIRIQQKPIELNKFQSKSVDNLTTPQLVTTKNKKEYLLSKSTKDLTKELDINNQTKSDDDSDSDEDENDDDASDTNDDESSQDEEEEEEELEEEEEIDDDENDEQENTINFKETRESNVANKNNSTTSNAITNNNRLVTVKSISGIPKPKYHFVPGTENQ